MARNLHSAVRAKGPQLRRNPTDGDTPLSQALDAERPSQLRRVGDDGGSVPGSQGSNAQPTQLGSQDSDLAIQTERLSLAVQSSSSTPIVNRLLCPVYGCRAHDQHRHHGWSTMVGQRAHVDGHMLGTLSGAVSSVWL